MIVLKFPYYEGIGQKSGKDGKLLRFPKLRGPAVKTEPLHGPASRGLFNYN